MRLNLFLIWLILWSVWFRYASGRCGRWKHWFIFCCQFCSRIYCTVERINREDYFIKPFVLYENAQLFQTLKAVSANYHQSYSATIKESAPPLKSGSALLDNTERVHRDRIWCHTLFTFQKIFLSWKSSERINCSFLSASELVQIAPGGFWFTKMASGKRWCCSKWHYYVWWW